MAEVSAVAARTSLARRLVRRPSFLIPAVVLALIVVIALVPAPFAGLFGHGDPTSCRILSSTLGPRPGHPFGFDVQGCDVYANVIFGARSSLAVGLLTTALALIVAVVMGTVAGLGSRVVDWIVSRLTDIFLGFPFLLGAIVVLTSVGERSVLTVSLVLALFGWPTMSRVMRSTVRGIRGSDYVLAARTAGYGLPRIVLRHVLPNAIGPVLVLATITVGSVIVAESTLTYLGIGLQSPAISWGLQLSSASGRFEAAPHLLVWPALFLGVTVLSLIGTGDAIRTAVDPRRRG